MGWYQERKHGERCTNLKLPDISLGHELVLIFRCDAVS